MRNIRTKKEPENEAFSRRGVSAGSNGTRYGSGHQPR